MTIGPHFGASIALARRDKELYVTQILHLRGLPLSLSSYLRFHGIKMFKAAKCFASLYYALISRFNGRLAQ